MKEHFKLEAIKNILVEMAVNDKLPMDMTTLDIHSIGEQAEERLKTDKRYQRACKIEKLGKFVSEDNPTDAYNRLIAQAEIDDSVDADDVVNIWEPLEFKYTVKELLKEIQ